jgi:hypothetical protein
MHLAVFMNKMSGDLESFIKKISDKKDSNSTIVQGNVIIKNSE